MATTGRGNAPSSSSTNEVDIPEFLESRKTGNRYRRSGALGEGGFATCYEVADLETGRRYAAKCVPKKTIKNQKQKAKLLSEIRIQQALSHKNIVDFVEAFEDDDNVYIILELCEKTTFIELLKARRRLNEDETRFYMRQLLDAVRYMHSKRIIHRDLKLGNLFLASDMSLKIGDFGLAAVLKSETDRKKTICGTPNYIAPEVLFDTENGHSYEVDIWSVGVIMYTLLVGRPPFQTKDVKAIYQKIRDNQYEFPSTVTMSSAARALITSLLTTRPDHRPQMEEIMNHEFFESQSTHTPDSLPESIFERPYIAPPPPSCSEPLSSIQRTLASSAMSLLGGTKLASAFAPRPTLQRALLPSLPSRAPPAEDVAASDENRPSQGRNPTPSISQISGFSTDDGKRTESKPVRDAPPAKVPHLSPLRERSANTVSAAASPGSEHSPRRSTAIGRASVQARSSPNIHSSGSRANSSALSHMLEYLEVCLDPVGSKSEVDRPHISKKGSQHSEPNEPVVFVNKWIDYSHKYGLGYQLTNGSIGVFFNDSTTIILAGNQQHFEYLSFDRQNTKSTLIRACHTLSDYPSELRKKVTLLCHFQNYITDNLSKIIPSYFELDTKRIQDLDFLTKYIRTKHAVLFRLSNRVLQVNFFDHTKLVLYSEGKMMSFVDQSKEIRSRPLADFVDEGEPTVMKRINYVRDVLRSLCSV